MPDRIALGVFVSGGGTNLQAIIDACNGGAVSARVEVVISDKAGAFGLQRARDHAIPAYHVPVGRNGSPSYDAADAEHVRLLREHGVRLVCLAGYMRRIGPRVLAAFPDAVMNIHPALLPSFPGTHGQRDALQYGTRVAGCTVHFADAEFDQGPIIVQAAVPVLDDDDAESLAARILAQEHLIYPQAIEWFAQGRLRIEGRRVRLLGAQDGGAAAAIVSPALEIGPAAAG